MNHWMVDRRGGGELDSWRMERTVNSSLPEDTRADRSASEWPEAFLHHIWKFRLFDMADLRTTDGTPIGLVRVGQAHQDAGPDFFDARIRIGKVLWVGNVEIHTHSREWQEHGHQYDPAYNNVVLHVVAHHDAPAFTENGRQLPVLSLQGRLHAGVLDPFRTRFQQGRWIPCGNGPGKVSGLVLRGWLDRLALDRLERKIRPMGAELKKLRNDWERTFLIFLGRNFGFKVNAEPFENLVRGIPFRFVHGERLSLFVAEALLFGMAGFLEDPERYGESYPRELAREFAFLRKKYELRPMPVERWKFARLRPSNFPTLRIAQFAALFGQGEVLFSRVLLTRELGELFSILDIDHGPYWQKHFKFGKESRKVPDRVGKKSVENIVVNTVIPMLYLYGKMRDDEGVMRRALDFLQKLSPEDNKVIRNWRKAGVKPRNAWDTQALLELKQQYCDRFRCLECHIGSELLKHPAG